MKKRSLVAIVGLLVVSAIGITFALSRDTALLNNDFSVVNYKVTMTDVFDSPSNWATCQAVPKTITVTNNSTKPVSVRIRLEEDWRNQYNSVLPLVSTASGLTMAQIQFANNSGWTQNGNYYYYDSNLASGATTSSLITGVMLNCDANLDSSANADPTSDKAYSNANYHLRAVIYTAQDSSLFKSEATVKSSSISMACAMAGLSGAKAFQKSDSPAPEGVTTCDYSDPAISDYPLYLWRDGDAIMWYSQADSVYLARFSNQTFSGMYSIETAPGLASFDASRAESLNDMFYENPLADASPLSKWDVSNVENFAYMFAGTRLTNLDALANWNVSNATRMMSIFNARGVDVLTDVCGIAGWDVSKVKYNDQMFVGHSHIDARCLESWDTSNFSQGSIFSNPRDLRPSWDR